MFSLGRLLKVILSAIIIIAPYSDTAIAADYLSPQSNITVSEQNYSKDINLMYGAGRYMRDHFPVEEQRALPQFHPQRPAYQASNINQTVATNVNIQAGDSAVSASVIQTAGKIINAYSLPTIQNTVGLAPGKNINIVLFSSYYIHTRKH